MIQEVHVRVKEVLENKSLTPIQKVSELCFLHPDGEVKLLRGGVQCKGCMLPDGTLYYAAVVEVNLDEARA